MVICDFPDYNYFMHQYSEAQKSIPMLYNPAESWFDYSENILIQGNVFYNSFSITG